VSDGHVEGDRSCLDIAFVNPRLRNGWRGGFDRVIGNPPFGDTVKAGDRDLLGENSLEAFSVAGVRKPSRWLAFASKCHPSTSSSNVASIC
jgi:predicted RNA methylase